VRLVDAPRCPYCARVRLVLVEKGIDYEPVVIDLSDRPAWVYELNRSGRVPILEEDEFVLPESDMIMAYLEERYPEPALLNGDLRKRALARLRIHCFDASLGDDYYAFRRGDENELAERLETLDVGDSLYSDLAYVPWVIRARDMLGVQLPERLERWLDRLAERPSVAAEIELVRSL